MGVMLQDSEARSDIEDKLCDCSGLGVLTEHPVGMQLMSLLEVELRILSF
jgi:hypothetical protein